MVEKRTGKKMASKMCDLRANATKSQKEKRDAQKVQGSQGSPKKLFVVFFLVRTITWVFLGFSFAGLNFKFSCPKKSLLHCPPE